MNTAVLTIVNVIRKRVDVMEYRNAPTTRTSGTVRQNIPAAAKRCTHSQMEKLALKFIRLKRPNVTGLFDNLLASELF